MKSLKNTIEDIRNELEKAEIDKSDFEGKILPDNSQEIKSLQTSLIQARDKCERLVIERRYLSGYNRKILERNFQSKSKYHTD